MKSFSCAGLVADARSVYGVSARTHAPAPLSLVVVCRIQRSYCHQHRKYSIPRGSRRSGEYPLGRRVVEAWLSPRCGSIPFHCPVGFKCFCESLRFWHVAISLPQTLVIISRPSGTGEQARAWLAGWERQGLARSVLHGISATDHGKCLDTVKVCPGRELR